MGSWGHSDPEGSTANVYLIPFDSGAERRLTTGKFFGGGHWLRGQRLVTMLDTTKLSIATVAALLNSSISIELTRSEI